MLTTRGFGLTSSRWIGLLVLVGVVSSYGGYRVGRRGAGSPTPPDRTPPSGPVLASYDGAVIDSTALLRRLDEDGPFIRQQVRDPRRLTEYLREWIRVALLAQRARDTGLAEQPELQRETERRLADAYLKAHFAEDESKKRIDDADLRTAFQAHRAEYQRPELFELGEILFSPHGDSDSPAKARARATGALARLQRDLRKDPYAFDALARNLSEDPEARSRGGRLPPLTRAEAEARLGQPTVALLAQAKPGAPLAQVVQDGEGFAVMTVLHHSDPVDPSFEALRSTLRVRMTAERKKDDYDAFMNSLEKDAHVVIHDDNVGQASTAIR